jgi:DNA-binding beta-propeller fold protein YncE
MRIFSIGLLACLFAATSCGQSAEPLLGDYRALVANSLSEDISLIHDDYSVTKSAVTVGSAPNQIIIRGKEAIVISSLSNSIQVIDIKTWKVVREYNVGDGCNPYLGDLTQDDLLVITCNQSNELILVDPDVSMEAEAVLKRMDLPTGTDLFPFDPGDPGHARPQGVAVVGHKAYVTLSNLGDDWMPKGNGVIVVVDVAAWTADKLIELSKTNPAYIYRPFSGGTKLYIPCSGAFDGTGIVDVLDTTTDEIICTAEVGGAPGRIWVDDNGIAWVGDQLDGRLLKFDTKTCQVLDPIMLCPADYPNQIYDFIADVGTDGQGNVYACCFATDSVHIFPKDDPDSKRVVEVGDGPQAIVVIQR